MSPTPPRPPDLRPYFDELERFADGQMALAEQEAFELRLEQDEDLADAHAAYEQLTADLRWAAGHDTLRLRLQALDERMDQRGTALARAQSLLLRRQRRSIEASRNGVGQGDGKRRADPAVATNHNAADADADSTAYTALI